MIVCVAGWISGVAWADEPWKVRQRTGFAAVVGNEGVTDGVGTHLGATMVGVESRWGVQIGDWIGVYVPLHLSMGKFRGVGGTTLGVPNGLTGTLGWSLLADVTLADRWFVGAGPGVVVLNNPTASGLHLRAGAYPLEGRTPGGRRRGMSLSVDGRFVKGELLNSTYLTASIGFDAF